MGMKSYFNPLGFLYFWTLQGFVNGLGAVFTNRYYTCEMYLSGVRFGEYLHKSAEMSF